MYLYLSWVWCNFWIFITWPFLRYQLNCSPLFLFRWVVSPTKQMVQYRCTSFALWFACIASWPLTELFSVHFSPFQAHKANPHLCMKTDINAFDYIPRLCANYLAGCSLWSWRTLPRPPWQWNSWESGDTLLSSDSKRWNRWPWSKMQVVQVIGRMSSTTAYYLIWQYFGNQESILSCGNNGIESQ